ncbi:FeoA family protein [Hathewaya histolytica]|uniref:FeoA-like protein n=1 Tax=Hathewaya histolytica TaxID=1498 RepID=A0A4U9R4X1_HATHI|nr:FeoA family protein [Hathewaya histolytica]VTQ86432.1 FeoA-like protein [Hathewaya histolytica]
MPLSLVNTGDIAEVKEIKGTEIFIKRLMEMGVNTGANIKMVKNADGPLIIAIGSSRIVLGRGMAQKIMVSV